MLSASEKRSDYSLADLLLKIGAVAAVYLVCGRLGQTVALAQSNVSSVWPAAGVALAAVVIFGRKIWPAICLGGFATTTWSMWPNAGTQSQIDFLLVGVAAGTGTTLQALAGAALTTRLTGPAENFIKTTRGIVGFLAVAAPVSCFISASFGVTALALTHEVSWSQYGIAWLTWWTGDTMGVMVVTPLLLAWRQFPELPTKLRDTVLHAGVFGFFLLTIAFAFSSPSVLHMGASSLAFLPIPFVIWAAFRFGLHGATATMGILAVGAVTLTAFGARAVDNPFLNNNLLLLQTYIFSVNAMVLILAAATEERRLAQMRFQSVYEDSPLGISIVSTTNFLFVSVNQRFCEMLGYEAKEIIGKHPLQFTHYDDAAITRDLVRRLVNDAKAVVASEKRFIKKNGEVVWTNLTAAVLPDVTGDSSYVVAMVEDITQKRRSAEALRESEERFRRLAERVKLIPWEAKAQTCGFTYVGPQVADILGYSPEEWYRVGFWVEHIHPDDRPWVITHCKLQSIKHDNFEFEFRMIAKDGRTVWLTDIVNVLRDDSGPVTLRGFLIDISEHKRHEEELRLSKAEAEQAAQAKTDFLANMSHEIRTPLGAILGFSQLLLEGRQNEEAKVKSIKTIIRNGKHLLEVINDILDLSKIDAGELDIEIRHFSPITEIKAIAAMFEPEMQSRGISLFVNFEFPIPRTIRSDATRFRQILTNVIGNAVKFTKSGYVRLTARLNEDRGSAAGDYHLIVDVTDSGCGLSSDQGQKLFQPFSQGDSSMARKYGGTGLGLILSRRLARALNGDVTLLESIPGKGSTFRISVGTGPIEMSKLLFSLPPREAEEQTSASKSDSESSRPLENICVLLVDDSEDNQALIQNLLERAGAKVELANNGREAIERALRDDAKYDLVLMDIQMPELDGYQAVEMLRHEGFRSPVVALTAHAFKEDLERCLLAGCDDYLSKPVSAELLLQKVAVHGRRADPGKRPLQ